MSRVSITGNASGTGTFTIAAPNSNSSPTLTLPDATTTLVGTDATQTLSNKTIREMTSVISGNTNAVASTVYVFTATLTLTLPATPTAGDWVGFVNRSATTTPVIGRNGSNIMGLAEDLTVDNINGLGTLMYADATRGWVFTG